MKFANIATSFSEIDHVKRGRHHKYLKKRKSEGRTLRTERKPVFENLVRPYAGLYVKLVFCIALQIPCKPLAHKPQTREEKVLLGLKRLID